MRYGAGPGPRGLAALFRGPPAARAAFLRVRGESWHGVRSTGLDRSRERSEVVRLAQLPPFLPSDQLSHPSTASRTALSLRQRSRFRLFRRAGAGTCAREDLLLCPAQRPQPLRRRWRPSASAQRPQPPAGVAADVGPQSWPPRSKSCSPSRPRTSKRRAARSEQPAVTSWRMTRQRQRGRLRGGGGGDAAATKRGRLRGEPKPVVRRRAEPPRPGARRGPRAGAGTSRRRTTPEMRDDPPPTGRRPRPSASPSR